MPDVEQTFTFIDPDGVEFPLTTDLGTGTNVEFGVEGRGMPRVESVIERVPQQSGGRRRETTFGVREVVVPLELLGASASDLRVRLRALLRAFDPTRGDSVLRCVAPDGMVRQIGCRYDSGMEVVESLDLLGNVQRAAVVFRAADPFWYDTAVTGQSFGPTQAFFFPILPLRLSGSEVYASADVINDGDVLTWPTWTITGPGNNPVLRNLTTGKRIDLTGVSLAAGESINVDTRPGRKTVSSGVGANLYGSMTTTSSLWPLVKGTNTIRLEMSASTPATSLALSFQRRWLGA